MPPHSENRPPEFPIDAETFCGTLAQIAAAQGEASAVAILAIAAPRIDHAESQSDWGREWEYYTLRLGIDAALYGRLGDERQRVAEWLATLAREVSQAHYEHWQVTAVNIIPTMAADDGWRADAKRWLTGDGINNQGRVRSANVAARVHDGLLFRSQPEIHLYDALKAKGVYLAPLSVFIRGAAIYQRLEPDFVLVYRRVLVVVEVDGATLHRESPAEAHARTQGLQREGVRVERVPASECSTRLDADRCASRLMEALESYRRLRV